MHATPESEFHLSVSIVLHNSHLDDLRETLRTLYASIAVARKAGILRRADVVLVDNASGESYRSELKTVLEGAANGGQDTVSTECLSLQENRGFGAGHNAALAGQESDVHLILNPDVSLHADSLAAGLSRLRDDAETVLLSPLVTANDGRREYLCKAYPSLWVLLLRGYAPGFVQGWFQRSLAAYELRRECSGDREAVVEIASGCFMLARRKALQAVGGFDERFFLYFEDFDLSLRLGSQGRLLFYPAMRIVHGGGYAARKGPRHACWFVHSAFRFFNLHGWRRR